MEIVDLAAQPESIREQAAALLVEAFPNDNGWPTLESGRAEVTTVAEMVLLEQRSRDASCLAG